MRTDMKRMGCLIVLACTALLMGGEAQVAGGTLEIETNVESSVTAQSAKPGRSDSHRIGVAGSINTSPPQETTKLVFIHHSTGGYWLDDGNGDLAATLGANNYFVSDTTYGWGPDSIGSYTDTGHWWNWFRGPDSATYLGALYSATTQYATYTRTVADPEGENEIIMFKSCYPNSALDGNPTDPPVTGENLLRGQDASSSYHTVGNAKGIYNDLLVYFAAKQDKLFVVVTAPPLVKVVTTAEEAANARALNEWLVSDWLADYAYSNVVVFDFYNVLTSNGGDPDTNDYGLAAGNHHRYRNGIIEHIADQGSNYAQYPSGYSDSHPTEAGNQKATGEFVPLLNAYYNCWKGGDCWGETDARIGIAVLSDAVGSVEAGQSLTYTMSVTSTLSGTSPVTLTVEGVPLGATAALMPNLISPPDTAELLITTTEATAGGIYPISVTARSGELSDTANLTLIVSTASPSLTLAITPTAGLSAPKGSVTYTVSVGGVDGFSEQVSLSLIGLPQCTSASCLDSLIFPGESTEFVLVVSDTSLLGDYRFRVVAEAGLQLVDAVAELQVDYDNKVFVPVIVRAD